MSHRLGWRPFLRTSRGRKALRGALIARGIATRKSHDLVKLQSSLTPDDAVTVSSDDIDILGRAAIGIAPILASRVGLHLTTAWPQQRILMPLCARRPAFSFWRGAAG